MQKSLGRLRFKDYFTDLSFPFRIQRHRLNTPLIGTHTHEFTELVIVLSGQGTHVTGRRTAPLAAGDVFVIAGQRSHSYRDLRDLELVNILFRAERLFPSTSFLRGLPGYHALFVLEPRYHRRAVFRGHLRLDPASLALAVQFIVQLEKEDFEQLPGHEAAKAGLLLQLVTLLARRYRRVRSDAARPVLRMADTLSYLETRFVEPLRLPDLAARAHLSVNQFLRVFREATGHSPIAYQIRLRVLKAAGLLQGTSCRVTEAAYAVGFNDSNYFSKQFRKVMGLSPRAYRFQGVPRIRDKGA
jgi:AraC family L-rhamnose operon transcriptional activator RhaR